MIRTFKKILITSAVFSSLGFGEPVVRLRSSDHDLVPRDVMPDNRYEICIANCGELPFGPTRTICIRSCRR